MDYNNIILKSDFDSVILLKFCYFTKYLTAIKNPHHISATPPIQYPGPSAAAIAKNDNAGNASHHLLCNTFKNFISFCLFYFIYSRSVAPPSSPRPRSSSPPPKSPPPKSSPPPPKSPPPKSPPPMSPPSPPSSVPWALCNLP